MKITDTFPFSNLQAKVAIKMAKVAIKMVKVAIKAKSFAGHQALFAKINFLKIRNYVRTFLFRDKCPEQDIR